MGDVANIRGHILTSLPPLDRSLPPCTEPKAGVNVCVQARVLQSSGQQTHSVSHQQQRDSAQETFEGMSRGKPSRSFSRVSACFNSEIRSLPLEINSTFLWLGRK